MMNDEHDSDFAEYLLDKHYSATTVGSYCRMLKNLKIDDSLIEPTQIYENINRCLDDYSSYAGSRAVAIAKVVVNRYFEMKTGRHVSEFINSNDRHEIAILNEFYQYSVNFKKMTVAASKAECQHIRFFLNSLDENRLNNLSSITAADIRKYITDHFQRLKPSSIGRYITSLRNFFRFLNLTELKLTRLSFCWSSSMQCRYCSTDTSVSLHVRYRQRLYRCCHTRKVCGMLIKISSLNARNDQTPARKNHGQG